MTVNLARDIARELDLPYKLEIYTSARAVVEAASQGTWDFAFIARDPKRSESITFSDPYFLIEGNYLVRKASPITSNSEVDQAGITVAVGKGAAYDLYLTRHLQYAEIIRTDGTKSVMDMFIDNGIDVAAGIRPSLESHIANNTNLRLLPDPFMYIEQAIATPVQNRESTGFIKAYLKDARKSGRLKKLCETS
ncbi:transporter substrate-binding domain-containing protein [Thalassospiraceae bacterium SW-3-3]|nr:transporter substrate-binding domain-containing protein [Thalassospiraceae bacterium SW-3-3]